MFTLDDINIGDRVRVVDVFSLEVGNEGVVTGMNISPNPMFNISITTYVVKLDRGIVKEYGVWDIRLAENKEPKTGCKCGAITAHGPITRHSHWCDLFKEND